MKICLNTKKNIPTIPLIIPKYFAAFIPAEFLKILQRVFRVFCDGSPIKFEKNKLIIEAKRVPDKTT